jgi:hypothetical protein
MGIWVLPPADVVGGTNFVSPVSFATATAVFAWLPFVIPKTSRPRARRMRAPAPTATSVRVDSVQLAVKPGPVGSAPQMPPPPPPRPGSLKPPKGAPRVAEEPEVERGV